jgi:hypothetical protein
MREPHTFPKDTGKAQLNIRCPSFLLEEIRNFTFNPFTPVNSLTEFVLDAMVHSLENWKGAELSVSARRRIMLYEIEKRKQDEENELSLYMTAQRHVAMNQRTEAEALLSLLNDDHRVDVTRMLGGGGVPKAKADLKVVPDAISE